MVAPPPGNAHLQQMLQSAVQAVQWTYTIFWQFCPQQGVLVWSDGYYNGAIKTRKTVQPMEVSAEEASLQRSQQLRELYDSLSAGETNPLQPARRPSAALSPEDLTETEWFYLMCVSFSFPPAVGLPGKAYSKRQHVWLTGAHEVDSKVFSRAILAKTVVCIPLMDGVVELGSTERLPEDPLLVQHVKTFFVDHHRLPPPKPALSEQSTSNPAASSSDRFHSPPIPVYSAANPAGAASNIHQVNEDDDDDDEDNESDSEAETGRNSRPVSGVGQQNPSSQAHLGCGGPSNSAHTAAAEPSELMQVEMSEDIRLGSPEDASNNMDPDFPAAMAKASGLNIPGKGMVGQQRRADSFSRAESSRRWPLIHHDSLLQQPLLPPTPSAVMEEEESAAEDTHYSQTVSSILQYQVSRWSASEVSPATTTMTPHSAFSKWPPRPDHHVHLPEEHNSQWLLKYILLTVPFLHTASKAAHDGDNSSPKSSREPGPDPSSRFRGKGAGGSQNEELSGNHVLAERRRREKLNERFIILRSLVPFVTKMDKASILGDTIEYVKQLRRKIQDLEARAGQVEAERVRLAEAAAKSNSSSGLTVAERARVPCSDKRKVRVVEGSCGAAKAKPAVELSAPPILEPPSPADMLQVSIIESDALIELQCPYREGLLLDMMVVLREMRVEVTGVQSSLNNGFFTAEMRAKVKENVNGKKASIVEVKRAITQIVPHSNDL
ncbi:hypothetical protein V2J09_016161 [Rumex salicifolius]